MQIQFLTKIFIDLYFQIPKILGRTDNLANILFKFMFLSVFMLEFPSKLNFEQWISFEQKLPFIS